MPTSEGYNIPEFQLPTSTGQPAQVYQVPSFTTPIPDANPGDYAVYSTRAQTFTTPEWQGTSISAADLKAANSSVQVIEDAWQHVYDTRGYGGIAASGTLLHSDVKAYLESRGYSRRLEVSISSDGDAEINYGASGSIRLDVYEVKGGQLYIYDFKAGGATLTQPRIDEIVARAQETRVNGAPFTQITVIEVKR